LIFQQVIFFAKNQQSTGTDNGSPIAHDEHGGNTGSVIKNPSIIILSTALLAILSKFAFC
jgi:hypothetical protein